MERTKIGLIVEGGGMKCAYSAGVLDEFLDEGYDKRFDYGIGVSAGAANLASFEASQRDRNLRFYTIHAKDPRYISIRSLLTTGSYFGLQHIYGTMTNEGGGDPLDYDKMISNPMEMIFPATDAVTGEPRYFDKHELIRNDYRPIMATCCLPVLCKEIEYEGHFYFDGGLSDSIPVEKALADGCQKVVFISSKTRNYVKNPEKFKRIYTRLLKKKYPGAVKALDNRYINYNRSMDLVKELEKEGRAICFFVPDDIKISTYTTDPKIMQALYDHGLQDALEQKDQLHDFLEID